VKEEFVPGAVYGLFDSFGDAAVTLIFSPV
jgi:hypothetical protein